eukprot:m.266286 g.266286  ORF g.266286 m.266286 type:complete len:318 (-) comp15629_c0_seq1:3225-4178(-)
MVGEQRKGSERVLLLIQLQLRVTAISHERVVGNAAVLGSFVHNKVGSSNNSKHKHNGHHYAGDGTSTEAIGVGVLTLFQSHGIDGTRTIRAGACFVCMGESRGRYNCRAWAHVQQCIELTGNSKGSHSITGSVAFLNAVDVEGRAMVGAVDPAVGHKHNAVNLISDCNVDKGSSIFSRKLAGSKYINICKDARVYSLEPSEARWVHDGSKPTVALAFILTSTEAGASGEAWAATVECSTKVLLNTLAILAHKVRFALAFIASWASHDALSIGLTRDIAAFAWVDRLTGESVAFPVVNTVTFVTSRAKVDALGVHGAA